MKIFSFSSLRIRLILLVLFAVIPALGLMLYSGLEQRRHARFHALDDALELAKSASKTHMQIIEATHQFLNTLAQLPQVRNQDPAGCCSLFAELLKQNPQYLNIGAVDQDGNIFASALPLTQPINVSDRSYFRNALQTRNFAIGDYQIGRITGKPAVNFGYPILNAAGTVKTVIFTALDLLWINKLTPANQMHKEATFLVTDNNGIIIARYPDPEKFVGKSIAETDIVKAILAKREGVEEGLGLDGIPRLFGFTLLGPPSGAVYVCVGIPKKVAFAEVDKMMKQNLIWLGLVAVLVPMAAWFVGGLFVIHPVNRLLSVTKRLADGDLTARAEMGRSRGELNLLAYAFDDMAISLEQREAERKQAEEASRKSEAAAKRLAQENATIAEIGRIISSSLNINEVYEHFSEEVRKLIPFDRISITLHNFEENTIIIAYVAGIDVPGRRVGDVIPMDSTSNKEIARTRSSLLIQTEDRVELVARFPTLLPNFQVGLRSMMAIPLISKDQVIGVLHIRSIKLNAYSKREIRLAERVANQIAGAIANAQLFTERKQAEEALQRSKEFAETILNSIDDDISIINARDFRITGANQSFLTRLGFKEEEIVGKFCYEVTHYRDKPCSPPNAPCPLQEALKTGKHTVFEHVHYHKDGKKICVEVSASPIKNEKEEISQVVHVARDVTARKHADEEMSELQEQFRQSQKMEAIGRLAGGIAHDFNNLLTVIKGYNQLALSELKEDDPLKENVEEIQKAADRAANLTRQILAFSRRQILDMKVLDLNTLLRDLDKMMRRIIGEDIELVTLLAQELGRVKTDPGQIEQVIMNLAVNARDAMPNGGTLTIETADVELDEAYAQAHVAVTPGRYVMLSVSDTGCGMAPEVRDRIFEPFFTTKEKGQGTGLGLSTVYGIVKQSGGNIWVYSEPGNGSTIKIYLPRVDEDLEEMREKVVDDQVLRGSETILVVEDDEVLRKLVLRILEKQGYKISEACDGNEALLLCDGRKEFPDLVLTDVTMPRMSGHELAKRLKSLNPETKVLYMSGYTDGDIANHGILEKGTNYIQKPFTMEALARKVREVLNREGHSED